MDWKSVIIIVSYSPSVREFWAIMFDISVRPYGIYAKSQT